MGHQQLTSHDWRTWRRIRAWEVSQCGWRPCDIVESLCLGWRTVSRCSSAVAVGGPALRTRERVGPVDKLLPERRLMEVSRPELST